jgi:hypothetical protein
LFWGVFECGDIFVNLFFHFVASQYGFLGSGFLGTNAETGIPHQILIRVRVQALKL